MEKLEKRHAERITSNLSWKVEVYLLCMNSGILMLYTCNSNIGLLLVSQEDVRRKVSF